MKTRITILTALIILCAACTFAATPTQDAYTPPEIKFEVLRPVAGKVYSEGLYPAFRLTGASDREFEVEVRCFETTRYILATKRTPHQAPVGNDASLTLWNLYASPMLPMAGDQVCEVRLYELTNETLGKERRLLAEREIPFRYEPYSGEEYDKRIGWIRNTLVGAGWDLAKHNYDPRGPYSTWQTVNLHDSARSEALSYMDRLHWEFSQRMSAYAQAARFYDNALQPGLALSALKKAEEIWDAEGSTILNIPPAPSRPIYWRLSHWEDPPAHYDAWGYFYALRKDLDRAVHHYQESIVFFLHQAREHPQLDQWHKDRCNERAAWKMLEISRLHYGIKRDRAEHDLWLEKYWETLPESEGGGLLGQ
jgi:hypothetical protein